MRRNVQPGPVNMVVDQLQSLTYYPVEGLVATDGIVYGAISTVGTTAVEILNKLIDPGIDWKLHQIEVGLTQKFTELIGGTTNASLAYYWQAKQENVATIRDWINISGTLAKGIASNAAVEDTLAGFVPVGSIPESPIRFRLMAQAIVDSSMTGKVKNSSYIRLIGSVIPGN